MARIPCRKFTLADIMILVGFTAGGLAFARPLLEANISNRWWIAYPLSYGTSLLGSWSIVHLTVSFRHPRPSIRRLFRQPGLAASLVGLISMMIWTVFFGISVILISNRATQWNLLNYPSVSIGPAILGLWICLGLSRTLRAEKGWIDRSGIALGICWILLMLDAFYEISS